MSQKTLTSGRRRFLKTAALAGGAATVAAAGAAAVQSPEPAAKADTVPSPQAGNGYHVTPHIDTYYRLARR